MTDLSILGSKGESSQHTPVESPDSLINVSYANILDGISEGPIVGLVSGAQSIYLDKTPLANADGSLNFTGVTWEQRTGEHDQDHISGFPAVESQISVGVELKASQPWVQSFSNTELSAVRVQIAAGALMVTEEDGDRVGYRVAYEIDLSTDDSDYKLVHSGAFDGKTTTGYQRSIRIDLPWAERGWRLRVRRTTPDSTTQTIQATTSIGTYTEIIDAKLQYPYTALCGLKIDASQFSAVPERAYRIRGRIIQVPSNYDAPSRTYSGTWDGTFKLAWTDCPPWIWRDIVLNDRYGLGRFIDASQVDKWELYQIAQYCDQMLSDGKGGREPRFTCNVYLQSRADALTVLQDLATTFRGMSYYAGSQVACAADMPGDAVYTYTNANVIEGKFNRPGSSVSTRFSVAKVAWSDRENFGNQRVEYVQDQRSLARYGVRETEITAFGCVSQGQAQRAGQYILLTNRLETGTITFSVGLDGTICRPGDVIRVADEHYAGVPLAGRIKEATAASVTLDNDVTAAAGDTLVVILPKGVAETRIIRSIDGRVVTVTEPFSAVPVKESVYTVETAELVAETYRVLTVNENFGDDKLQYDIVAIARNDSKFGAIDNGAQIVIPPTSVLPAAVQAPPTNIELSTFDTLNQGINVATMRITWDAPRGAQNYRVWWKRNNGDWIYAGVTYTAALEVRGVYTGTYTARVAAVGVEGNSSVWALSEPTLLYGKTGEPPAITSLTTESLLFGIGLKWTFPPGAEDTQRTELWYSEGTDLAAATKLADLAYPQSEHVLQGLRGGQRFFFWARLVDRSGNVGPWFPADGTVVSGMASMDAGPILEQIKDQITESELGKELASKIEKIELIDGNGPGSVNDRIDEAKSELGEQVTNVNNALSQAKNDLQAQIEETDQLVIEVRDDAASARDVLQQQITQIGSRTEALPYKAGNTYTTGQAALWTDGKIYQATKAVPKNTPPPNATYWLDIGQAVITANGLAVRMQTVETKVGTLEGTTTAQTSQITNLQSGLTATNGNVTTAQQAATAAATLAGGKGKVIVQNAAPAVEDRLAQNLWIDTTGSANTPKRWTGSAWTAVTDKVATDAAAAAASALSQVSTKAEAAALNSLTTRVTATETGLTTQGQSITGLTNSLTTTNTNVTAAQKAATDAATLAGSKGKVMVQAAAPAVADRLPQNLWIDITGNANTPKRWSGSAWLAVTDKVATDAAAAAASALTQVATKAEAAAVQSLTTRVEKTEGSITTQGQAITGLTNNLSTTNGNVTAAQQAAQAASDKAGAKGEVIYGTTQPAADKRLSQNLWIDTTGGANTPKRWNGSAWVAVTDKVATDAAAAAASALSQVGTKADVSALNSLTTRVEKTETGLSTQGQSIIDLKATVANKAEASALNSLTTRVTATEDKNNSQDGLITSQGAAITTLNNSLADKASVASVNTLSNTVTQQGKDITAQGLALTTINANIGDAGGENLIFNPSFVKGAGNFPEGSAIDTGGDVTYNASMVTSWLNPGERAFRVAVTGVKNTNPYLSLRTRVKVAAGQTLTSSIYARRMIEAGLLGLRIYHQWLGESGTAISAPTSPLTVISVEGGRQSFTSVAPEDAVAVNIYFRIHGMTASATNGTVEVARPQAEYASMVTGWRDNGQALASDLSVNVAATTALAGRVEKTEQGLTTTSSQITTLTGNLTTTNGNVTAAQAAADAANTLAGGKGKVIVQSAAPAVADRLAQNLWIDTTGNANAPKRWNGSAWTAVTDKVATDAAAAAASALSQVATKADASTVNTLTNTVTQQGKDITANGTAITAINTSISEIGGENFILNPSFDTARAGAANLPENWKVIRSSATTTLDVSLPRSSLDPDGKALRLDVTGLAANDIIDTSPLEYLAAAQGQVFTLSTYIRGTVGLGYQLITRFRNDAGTEVGVATVSGNAALGLTWSRVSAVSVPAPYGTTKVDFYIRLRQGPTAPQVTAGFMEVDRTQLELGSVMTGWRDNTGTIKAALAAAADATTALTARVTATEGGLTSASGQITELNNSIGDVGGENLAYNPTFNKVNASNAALPDGWALEGAAANVPSMVTSWLNSGERAQRIAITGVTSGSPYLSLVTPLGYRVKVAPGQSITASIYARRMATAGLMSLRIWFQWIKPGTVISSMSSALNAISVDGSRFTLSGTAPEEAVECIVFFRVHAPSSTAVNGTVEFARPQVEYGTRMSGWRDNGQVLAAQQSATSTALDALTSTVTQTGKDLTSVSGRTTTLENNLVVTNGNVTGAQKAAQDAADAAGSKGKVLYQSAAPAVAERLSQNLWIDTTGGANTPKRWNGSAWVAVTDKVATDAAAAAASALSQVATKADSSAVTALGSRVTATEGSLTAQSSDITQLKNSIGSAQAFVAGMAWEFTGNTRGWLPQGAGQTFVAGPLFATLKGPGNFQCNFTPNIDGSENPYLRIRLRRRSTTRTGAQMYWANQDGGLAEARRQGWPINLTTNDWQDIEIDLSGHVGWDGKSIYSIRLDMNNSGDANAEIDIAYIAVGRRSVAGSAQALSSLSSQVSLVDGKIVAETGRIDGLYTSVGNTSAAVQDEVKARSDADSALSTRITTAQAAAGAASTAVQSEVTARANADTALGKRVDTVQSNLGSTNAAVQQISTAQSSLDGKVNATYSVRLQAMANGQYAMAGIGAGIDNNGGILQSTVAVIADRFAVMNPAGNGYILPFAIQNGQVVMNDALISKLSVQNALVSADINSSLQTAQGLPLMQMITRTCQIIMRHPTRANTYTLMDVNGIDVVVDGVRRVRMGVW